MTMLSELRVYLDRKGIGALRFACQHAPFCSKAGGTFTEAKESFVGPEYEKGTLPRLLFLSLDSGSAEADPTLKTIEAVRAQELARDVLALPRGRHWYETHELAWFLLQQFKSNLKLAEVTGYFAHVNSAKCCLNHSLRRQAADVLFDNCREFIPPELRILKPDIIVSQGGQAKRVMERFRAVRPLSKSLDGERCEIVEIRCGEKRALWIATHHPTARGGLYKRQKKACRREWMEAVRAFKGAGA